MPVEHLLIIDCLAKKFSECKVHGVIGQKDKCEKDNVLGVVDDSSLNKVNCMKEDWEAVLCQDKIILKVTNVVFPFFSLSEYEGPEDDSKSKLAGQGHFMKDHYISPESKVL
jgi:hypothetical protein